MVEIDQDELDRLRAAAAVNATPEPKPYVPEYTVELRYASNTEGNLVVRRIVEEQTLAELLTIIKKGRDPEEVHHDIRGAKGEPFYAE